MTIAVRSACRFAMSRRSSSIFMGLPFGRELRNSQFKTAGNPTISRVFRGAALLFSAALGPLHARALGGLFLVGVPHG